MSQITSLEESYLALVEFLMLSKRHLHEVGSGFELNGMQVVALILLTEPRPMHYFTKFFNCDPSNTTSMVDSLESKGIVTRIESESDRRIKNVTLLPKAKKTRAALLGTLSEHMKLPLSKLSPSEAQDFIKLVQKITQT